jgi:hypothetical protein
VAKSLKDEEAAKTNAQGFDKVFEMDVEDKDNSDYCKHCKYESRWCKHRKIRDDHKAVQASVITTAQTLGWREHYDTAITGNARVGVCKRTFNDPGHL